MTQRSVVCMAAAALMVAGARLAPAVADAAGPDAGQTPLETVVVTATRGPRAQSDVAGTVTVKTDEAIADELARDIKDLVRYEPGISVANSAGRFGLSGFNIRGIDGNRVLMEVDGVPVPDAFSIGSFASAGRDFVDLELLEQVEILRGAASSLFGSDAIGGVVAFTTRDPMDLLADSDRDFGGRLRGSWFGSDEGFAGTASAAWRSDAWSAMLVYTRRDGSELDNQGTVASDDSTRTAPDPQDYYSDNVLAKLVWADAPAGRMRLTLESQRTDVFTNAISARRTQSLGPAAIQTTSLTGDDEQLWRRVSLDQQFGTGGGWFDDGAWNLYWQDGETIQYTTEQRITTGLGPPTETLRERRAEFLQEVVGGELTFRKALQAGSVQHTLTWGAELIGTETEQLRDGRQTNLTTGAVTNVIPPDTFPVRDFPVSDTLEAALFLQDEIRLAGGDWMVIPGLRVDYYDLDPQPDEIFEADNPGFVPVGLEETSVSPKLGVLRRLGGGLTAFAQYAQGFRAPPYNDVNVGFTNIQFGYTAIPNPDLEPETSQGLELGLRGRGEAGYFTLAGYYNDYEDFIESFVPLGVDPTSGLLVFQSQNIAEARIYGVEFGGGLDLGAIRAGLGGWQLRASVAWSRGDDQVADTPLASVDPLKGVLGVRYEDAGGRWRAELIGTAVAGPERVDELPASQYDPPGYTVLDLLGYLSLGPAAELRVGLFNLTDEKYWEWADVQGRPAGDPVIDRYSRPGRSVSASISLRF